MSRPTYPHDLDLGGPVEPGTLEVLIQGQRDSELVRGVLQLLRNHAANIERIGRQPPAQVQAQDWRPYHAGGADAVEEALMMLYGLAHPDPGQPEELPEQES